MLSVLPTVEGARRRAALLPSSEHALVAAVELGMHDEAARIGYAIGELTLGGGATPRQVWLRLSRPDVLATMPPATRLAALVATGDWASESAGNTALMVRVADEAVALARETGSAGDLAIALTKHLAWCHVNGRVCEASDEEALVVARGSDDDQARCGTEMFAGCLRGDPELLRGSLEAAPTDRPRRPDRARPRATSRRCGSAGVTPPSRPTWPARRWVCTSRCGPPDAAGHGVLPVHGPRAERLERRARPDRGPGHHQLGERETRVLVTDVLLKLRLRVPGGRVTGPGRAGGPASDRAYLASRDLEVAEDEQRLLDQWLDDVVPVRPEGALSEEVAALVAAARRDDA